MGDSQSKPNTNTGFGDADDKNVKNQQKRQDPKNNKISNELQRVNQKVANNRNNLQNSAVIRNSKVIPKTKVVKPVVKPAVKGNVKITKQPPKLLPNKQSTKERKVFHPTLKKQVLTSNYEGSDVIPATIRNFIYSQASVGAIKGLERPDTSNDKFKTLSHCESTLLNMEMIREKNEMCDMIINVSDCSEFKVHGIVLAGCSKWIRERIGGAIKKSDQLKGLCEMETFNMTKTSNGTFKLHTPQNTDKETIKEILHYCYHGKFSTLSINTPTKKLVEILRICVLLEFIRAKKDVLNLLCEKCDIKDFFVIYYLTKSYKSALVDLSNTLWHKAFLEFDKIIGKEEFSKFEKDDISEMISRFKIHSEAISTLGSEQLLSALLTWCNSVVDNDERKNFTAVQIKNNVQFNTCSENVLKSFEGAMESLFEYDHSLASLYSNALFGNSEPVLEVKKNKPNKHSTHNLIKTSTPQDIKDLNEAGFILLSGGRLFDSFNAVVFHLDLNSGKWKEITRLPDGALAHHSTALIRNNQSKTNFSYFIIGGQSGAHIGSLPNTTCSGIHSVPTGKATEHCWELICNYNDGEIEKSWNSMPDLNQPRSGATLSVLGSNLFIVGGRCSQTIRNTCELINLEDKLKSWTFTSPLKIARHSHSSAVLGDVVYISGGISSKDSILNDMICVQPLSPNGVFWTILEPMSIGRANHSMLMVCHDRILVTGGTKTIADSDDGDLSFIHYYSPVINSWQCVKSENDPTLKLTPSAEKMNKSMTKERQKSHFLPQINVNDDCAGSTKLAETAAINFIGNKILVIGGWDAGRLGKFNHSNQVWIYDVESNLWDLAGGIPQRLRAASGNCLVNFV